MLKCLNVHIQQRDWTFPSSQMNSVERMKRGSHLDVDLLLSSPHFSFTSSALTFPPSSPQAPPHRHRMASNIYAAGTGADCSNTHITVSRFVKVCVCVRDVYYLYIRWLLVSAGITNMFLNISCEIVWNSQVSDDNDSLTALSGPRCFPTDTHTHVRTHTRTHLEKQPAMQKPSKRM